ncbi:MAG: cation:proton antiporter [Negativibacillus massiliensis]|uniref:cation:proton antiporter n=1 Tax=Negativibacillus massiliensis TaxID=1871035 RepID=UPI00033704D0|nr:cation:proton antiporter [Negativibacillus massiliensis]MCI6348947.1 cation:proton antiporter [Negativibacillus massiliensis]CDA79067.1 transporter CPA2 family [Clostridium sp. CAG:242]
MSYHYLIDIALILLTTKVFGMITKRLQMPQVVGALIAGLVMGPAMLNIIHSTEFLSQVSELGVIVMMFTAGLGTSLNDLKQTGKAGFLVALCGVIVPLIGGTILSLFFNTSTDPNAFMQNVFIGVVLTATSVSITVEALKEMGKLNTVVGNTILAAALIDDVLGLIALTIVTSIGGSADANLLVVLLKIVAFFVLVVVVGIVVKKAMDWYIANVHSTDLQRYPIFAFILCLILSFCAEEFFGVADITGAFAAGLIISTTSKAKYIELKFAPLSYLLLTPIFFASIGLKVELPEMNATIVIFSILLVVVAVLTKWIGCGLGAKLCGLKGHQCEQIGVGMVCRGEVALIVADKGAALGLMPEVFFGPVIIMVVATTILTPILLKFAYRKSDAYEDMQESSLVDRYDEVEQLDYIGESLIRANEHMMKKGKKAEKAASETKK